MNGQMTELEAVNEVLAAVGDQPVQTLAAGTYIEAVRIQQILRNTSRRIQSKGWWFNEIENKTFEEVDFAEFCEFSDLKREKNGSRNCQSEAGQVKY